MKKHPQKDDAIDILRFCGRDMALMRYGDCVLKPKRATIYETPTQY